jgi:hypothetical protein
MGRAWFILYIGNMRLSELTAPMVSEFPHQASSGNASPRQGSGEARSSTMIKKMMGSLSLLLAGAQEAGYVAQTIVRSQP